MPAGPARKNSCNFSSEFIATSYLAIASPRVASCTVETSVLISPPLSNSPRMPITPPALWTSSTWKNSVAGATLQTLGTFFDSRSMSAMVKSTSASCAAANKCRMVFVEPPIAMSKVIAFSNASTVAMFLGSTDSSLSR